MVYGFCFSLRNLSGSQNLVSIQRNYRGFGIRKGINKVGGSSTYAERNIVPKSQPSPNVDATWKWLSDRWFAQSTSPCFFRILQMKSSSDPIGISFKHAMHSSRTNDTGSSLMSLRPFGPILPQSKTFEDQPPGKKLSIRNVVHRQQPNH